MSQFDELSNAVFGLMATTEEMQMQAKATQDSVKNTAETLPEVLKRQIDKSVKEKPLGDVVKDTLNALQGVSRDAQANSAAMKSTTQKAWLVHIAVVIAAVGYAVTGITLKNRLAKRSWASLKAR